MTKQNNNFAATYLCFRVESDKCGWLVSYCTCLKCMLHIFSWGVRKTNSPETLECVLNTELEVA